MTRRPQRRPPTRPHQATPLRPPPPPPPRPRRGRWAWSRASAAALQQQPGTTTTTAPRRRPRRKRRPASPRPGRDRERHPLTCGRRTIQLRGDPGRHRRHRSLPAGAVAGHRSHRQDRLSRHPERPVAGPPGDAGGENGIDKFNEIASQCYQGVPDVCPSQRLAIVLDSVVQSAPTIQAQLHQGPDPDLGQLHRGRGQGPGPGAALWLPAGRAGAPERADGVGLAGHRLAAGGIIAGFVASAWWRCTCCSTTGRWASS